MPYINCSLRRISSNGWRIKSYIYAINEWLLTLPESERRRYMSEAKDSYYSNKSYNEFRDELSELRAAGQAASRMRWRQSFIDFPEFA